MRPVAKIVFVLFFISSATFAQSDSLGLAGDNLDLRAVLNIFKESKDPEDFEKKLNSADSKINNLDLNNDGKVDYLRVTDSDKKGVHTIVIQDPVGKSEAQDVAVITVQKKGDKDAHLQIVGDETLYGNDYIIEPGEEEKTGVKKKSEAKTNSDDMYDQGSSSYEPPPSNVTVNVWAWPAVTYMYSPSYVVWVSPWYWGYYPGWYSPWQPYGYGVYHGGLAPYHYGFYTRRVHYYRSPGAYKHYYGRRASSGYVGKTVPKYQPRQSKMQGNQNRISGNNNGYGGKQPANNKRVGNSNNTKQGNPSQQGKSPRIKQQQTTPKSNPNPNPNKRVGGSPQVNPGTKSGGGTIRQPGGGNPSNGGGRVGGGGRKK